MITLSQAQAMLARYVGVNNNSAERINLVCERLMKAMNARSTKETVLFRVYPDELGRGFITLPRQYNTVLAGVLLRTSEDGLRCGVPLPVQQDWYSYLETGPGFSDQAKNNWGSGFLPEVDRFTTFKNWETPKYIRLKFATAQAAGTYNIRGKNQLDETIYTGTGVNMIEGEDLETSGASTLTTTSLFIEPPYGVSKPNSYGPVKMYTWDGSVEELVAVYDPLETVPTLRRYRIAACTEWTEEDPGFYLAVCKREWLPIGSPNDRVIPGNIGALRFGLNALLSEDSQDFARSEEQWQKAYDLLAKEEADDTGAATHTPVQVADTYMLGEGAGYGWGGNGYWNR